MVRGPQFEKRWSNPMLFLEDPFEYYLPMYS